MLFHLNSATETKAKQLREQYRRMLITKKEAAMELGGISSSKVDRMRKEGLISSVKVRGRVMFGIEEIARVIGG